MTTSITFSLAAEASGGTPLALPEGMGTLSPGNSATQEFYITHDGSAKIEDCKLYINPYSSGVYLGTSTAQDDYEEVIGYGDTSHPVDPNEGGGLYLNMNHTGSFPTASYSVFRTGYGDTLANAVTLSASALNVGAGADGEIPADGEAHIKLKMEIPAAETDAGTRYVNIIMSYSVTS